MYACLSPFAVQLKLAHIQLKKTKEVSEGVGQAGWTLEEVDKHGLGQGIKVSMTSDKPHCYYEVWETIVV